MVKVNATDTKIAGPMELVTKTKCDLYNQGLEKKIDDVGKKLSNAIVLPKSVLPKCQIHNAIDRADKNRDKIKKFRRLFKLFYLEKLIFNLIFNTFMILSQSQLVLLE